MSDELRELYQEVILDHNKKPRNFHTLPDPAQASEGYNPLCGDRLTVFLRVENDLVQDISFQGSGCAISKASASMMTAAVKGKTIEEVNALFEVFHRVVAGQGSTEDLEQLGSLKALAGVSEFPAR
ncbi:MAG: SUF system NifU family Fe-S cluster assembly protein, partial [Candidatus Omnitrophica bacterium]|nr:SUF system NifU family Fe-S cluster assembly protein [Candidatus Omnitrophota bacterium]